MCLCMHVPIFHAGGRTGMPFMDELLGWRLADNLRSIVGARLYPDDIAEVCGCTDSYLEASFASPWAFAVFLLSLVAGSMLGKRRRAALWMLAGGAAVSLLDIGYYIYEMHRAGNAIAREMIMEALPVQLASNLVFQIALPAATGLALAALVPALGRAAAALFGRPGGTSSAG